MSRTGIVIIPNDKSRSVVFINSDMQADAERAAIALGLGNSDYVLSNALAIEGTSDNAEEFSREIEAKSRLEYLRGELVAERISYGELSELQDLAKYIEPGDVQLLEPAGVPEFPEDNDNADANRIAAHERSIFSDPRAAGDEFGDFRGNEDIRDHHHQP